MLNKFKKPGLKTTIPINSADVTAKTKNTPAGLVTSKILKSLMGGRILNLTDLHGDGLRLKVL